MWVFTVDGFFSAVQHRDTPGAVMVRGRAEADIQHLATRLGVPVQTTPGGDYGYRCTVPAVDWASYLTDTVAELDYDNFKAACHGEGDRDRAMMRCWAAMADFQNDRQNPEPVMENFIEERWYWGPGA
jgi:hypothetical protein